MLARQGGAAGGPAGLVLLILCAGRGAFGAPASGAAPDVGAAAVTIDRAALESALALRGAATLEGVALGDGRSVSLELARFHVAAPGTRFVLGRRGADDVKLDFDPARVTLLRGRVAGETGSHVFLALSQWGSTGRIELAGPGGRYDLVPDAGAAPGTVRLRVAGGSPSGGPPPGVPLCGTTAPPAMPALPAGPSGGPAAPVTQQIELAIETDYEYFQLFDDLDAAGAYIVQLFGAVSDIYLRDVNTRVVLTFVRLWDDPDDLFNEEDPIYPFLDHWELNMGDVHRDTAQFVSGRRNFPYGGSAFVGSLCTVAGYSVCGYLRGFLTDPFLSGVDQYDIQVTAHELGHNCGTFHTHDYGLDNCILLDNNPQRGEIMSYCSQTVSGGQAVTDLRFHTFIQGVMRDTIFNSACIAEDCNGNGIDDAEDIALGSSDDANGNGIADECEDCNGNDVLDPQDIALGGSLDENGNGVPDECEADCNGNDLPDDLDIEFGNDTDLHGNGVLDGCEADCDGDAVSDYNEIQANLSLDVNRDAILDACQDCDGDDVIDVEALGGSHFAWVASEIAGAPVRAFHPTTGVVTDTTAVVLQGGQDVLITPAGRVLVSSEGDDRVAEFDVSGAYVGDFVAPGSGGLDHPAAMVLAPDGNLLVVSRNTHGVLKYHGTTGAFLGAFVASGAGGLSFPWGIAFGPGGSLFVTSAEGRVVRFNGQTGALIGVFVPLAGNGGLLDPRALLFKPDGNLLAASYLTNEILEYDGSSGAFLGKWNKGGTATALTLNRPWGLRLGRDGNVYVSRNGASSAAGAGGHIHHEVSQYDDAVELHINSTRIYIFDVETGNFLRSYVTGNDTGLDLPTGFDFMPGDAIDCNLNQLPDSCDVASGSSQDHNGNGVPDECDVPGDANGDGLVNVTDLLALLGAWGPCPSPPAACAADFDDDGDVDVSDLLMLLGNWG